MKKISVYTILGLIFIFTYIISSHFMLLPSWMEGILSIGGLLLCIKGAHDKKRLI